MRLSLLSAALWWAGFTLIPVLRLRDYARAQRRRRSPAACCSAASAQLCTTLREMRSYPMTLTFLVAFLFYNDGIQTVIGVASTYGSKQLGFGQSVLIATILLIQFVAFGGALLFGRLAARFGVLPLHPGRHLRLDGDRRAGDVPARRRTSRCSWPSAWPSRSCSAAPRRCPGRSSAC